LVTGGGRHNPAIMAALRAGSVASPTGQALGWDECDRGTVPGSANPRGLPISFPTTGIPRPMTGGRMTTPVAT
jgi:anhydro-N-acetylmuramic acid kinase